MGNSAPGDPITPGLCNTDRNSMIADDVQDSPNRPAHSGSKHVCAICGDETKGKHYGVYSCEGCKGFFKRTVRKNLTYVCRQQEINTCVIDKLMRNRCQYCRYQKCLEAGMKRVAVQEGQGTKKGDENAEIEPTSSCNPDSPDEIVLISDDEADNMNKKTKEKDQNVEIEPASIYNPDMTVELILRAENKADTMRTGQQNIELQHSADEICQVSYKQLMQLLEWAKHTPHFKNLPIGDQVLLLRVGWNELMIAAFAHRSLSVKNGIVLATGFIVDRDSAQQVGVEAIFDHVLSELVSKMRDMNIDRTELGCLRTIILFNPGCKGLQSIDKVEILRDKVYVALEEYCRITHPEEPNRFAKLLLRLPSLRSVGLKCLKHLFYYKLIGDSPIDTFLMEVLKSSHDVQVA